MPAASHTIDAFSLAMQGLPGMVVIALALLLAGLAVWYYHGTIPPLTGWRRWAFTLLRLTALLLLLAAIADPVLRIIATVVEPATVAVLVDTSASMQTGSDSLRSAEARDAIARISAALGNRARWIAFDVAARTVTTPPEEFSGSGTDIAAALQAAAADPTIEHALLISDGRWNLGEDPASMPLGRTFPVHVLSAGASGMGDDAAIRDITVPASGREGTPSPVEILVTTGMPRTGAIPVDILDGERVLARGTARFDGSSSARVKLDLPLDGKGDRLYTVRITTGGEDDEANNTRVFGIRVTPRTTRILILAALPSPDLAFLQRTLGENESFVCDTRIARGVAPSPSTPALTFAGIDAVVILDGGGTLLDAPARDRLADWVRAGGGVWFLGDTPPSLIPGLPAGQPVKPIAASPSTRTYRIGLTPAGMSHPVTGYTGQSPADWGMLPPLATVAPIPTYGEVLATAVASAGPDSLRPAIIASSAGTGRILVMPLTGIWRWRLMMEGAGRGSAFYASFVTGVLSWLATPGDTGPLTVTTDQPTYLGGQEVRFTARLLDTLHQPLSAAEVALVIDDDPATRLTTRETAPGIYTGALRGLAPGNHQFRATALRDGASYAEDTGAFTVQDFTVEMLDTRPDPATLAAIASRTGGAVVDSAGLDSLLVALVADTRIDRKDTKHRPLASPLMPIALIGLIIVEWVARKKRGML